MATTEDLALLSLDAYSDPSQEATLNGWTRQTIYAGNFEDNNGTGLVRLSTRIAATTSSSPIGVGMNSDDLNDIFLGAYIGNPFEQIAWAQALYDQVRVVNPTASITLTGHSLGGGLAAAIAVRNNETAETFAAIEMTEATYESMNGSSGSGWQIPPAQANTTLTREQIGNFGLVTNHVIADEIANWSDLPFVPDNIGVEDIRGGSAF